MQKWEYLTLTILNDRYTLNGQHYQLRAQQYELLNHLGEQGWEVVGFSVDQVAGSYGFQYVLKRTKP